MFASDPGNWSARCWSNQGAALFSDAGTCCHATRLAQSHSVGSRASTFGTWDSNPSLVWTTVVSAVGVRFSRDLVRGLSQESVTFPAPLPGSGHSNCTRTDRSVPFLPSIHQ